MTNQYQFTEVADRPASRLNRRSPSRRSFSPALTLDHLPFFVIGGSRNRQRRAKAGGVCLFRG